jgi:aspartyl-tRNA(Asn)/glutamyl-tRNA(Gln) amidotransferase subunit A
MVRAETGAVLPRLGQTVELPVEDIERIANLSAAEIGADLRAGKVCPVELAEYLLERAENSSDQHVFLTITRDRALGEAAAARSRLQAGSPASLLDGVPVAVKDVLDVAGTRTTAASALFAKSPVKERDSHCVEGLSRGGMIILGKLNMTEFAYSGLGCNPHFGTPRNPNDERIHRSPGGSSSGSGVAVAAGLVPCSIGSDTGGSIRVPAAFNGIIGYKAGEGRIDKTGVFPLSRTLDTIGPLGRSVTDCILVAQLMRGEKTVPVAARSVRGLRVLVPTNVVMDNAEEAVLDNFEVAVAKLADAGALIEREPFECFDRMLEIGERHGSITAAEAYHEYHGIIESGLVKRLDRRVVRRILGGKQMSAHDLLAVQGMRADLMARIHARLDGALLAMPTTPIVAPEIAPLEADDELFMAVNTAVLRNTVLGNILNLCGLALPTGCDEKGLPTSILFSAPGGADDFLLAHGLEIERIIRG